MFETLSKIRTKFWISKPRNYIRRATKKRNRVIIWNRHEGNPFQYQVRPDWPSFSLTDKFAFTHSPTDYAGPLYISNIYDKLQTFKYVIISFACDSTKCMYLNLVPGCSSSSCV